MQVLLYKNPPNVHYLLSRLRGKSAVSIRISRDRIVHIAGELGVGLIVIETRGDEGAVRGTITEHLSDYVIHYSPVHVLICPLI